MSPLGVGYFLKGLNGGNQYYIFFSESIRFRREIGTLDRLSPSKIRYLFCLYTDLFAFTLRSFE